MPSFLISILPTFYEPLLGPLIQKAQKDTQVKQFFVLSGSACVKDASKHVDEIDPCAMILIEKRYPLICLCPYLQLNECDYKNYILTT